MILAAITSALAIWAPPQGAKVVAYEEALLCASLTQAASELEGGESRYGRSLGDAALYWTLLAIQRSQVRGLTPQQAEAAQSSGRLDAVHRLSRGEARARRQLQQCRQKTPRLG